MPSIVRSVMSVLAGFLAAFFHIGAIEGVSHLLFPTPPGLDPSKPETILAYMKEIPLGALLMVCLAWVVGTFAGSWLTTRLAPAPQRNHGWVIGALFWIAVVANLSMIPHPAWFWVLSLVTVPIASYLGARLAAPSGGKPAVHSTQAEGVSS